MKKFMGKNFLLDTKTAKKLYHNYAKSMPIFDYHCHIDPKDIAEDRVFKTISEVWLGGDHYKWRGMRTNGIDEAYITGNKSDYEKFSAWAKTMPYTIGNPLYHWAHLELKRYFNIDEQLNEDNAKTVYDLCNKKLKMMSARQMILKSNVKAICTTDDPIDSLEYHKQIRDDDNFDVKVLPTFRPDKAIDVEQSWFYDWFNKLEGLYGSEINRLTDYKKALMQRVDFFHVAGCRIADHGLGNVQFVESDEKEINKIFEAIIDKKKLDEKELNMFKTYMLVFFGKAYAKRGWVMQYHIGALRNNSQRMMETIGPDTGFDSIADYSFADNLSSIINEMDCSNELPKTILYCLNPRDNEVLATMAGNFQGSGIKGKIQFGSGWWFNDQKDGMERQLEALCQLGQISAFVGMLTDSRSLLSYTRHEYFRRILCNKLGWLIENGEYPNDISFVGKVVQDICFNNAEKYFGI